MKLFAVCLVGALVWVACQDDKSGGAGVEIVDFGVTGSWPLEAGTVGGEAVPLVGGYRVSLTVERATVIGGTRQ